MRHPPFTLHAAALRGSLPRPHVPGAIEWEELPSLTSRVRSIGRALAAAEASASVWDATRPAALDPQARPSDPFREPVHGLAVREVVEPDVFRHFFGSASEPR